MDPLDFLESDELLHFFHRKKTEMSCIENPHVLLRQLRDYDLVPEDRYKKVSRMKSKENVRRGLYDILDWLERERSSHIKVFWSCVFKDTIINHYPTLRQLRCSLLDGSFKSDTQLPETDEGKRKELSEDEEGEEKDAISVKKKKKRNRRSSSVGDDVEEQAGPSSQVPPSQRKKSKKICFSSPLKKGEKSDIWTWPIYKCQLPVTCGDKEGILNRNRLAKGQKCIAVETEWFTPNEFQRFAGKESNKNWKLSIKCMDIPLGKLIQDGHLTSAGYKGRCKNAKKLLFPSDHVMTVSEGEEDEDAECDLDKEDQDSPSSKESFTNDSDEEGESEEQTEQQPEGEMVLKEMVLKVTCRSLAGTLHKKRFASGTRGKSIRTETSWMSPEEFMKAASCPDGASWRKEIKCEGLPLSVLLERKTLVIHSLLCSCRLCERDSEALENQKNDDECCICKGEEEEVLVVCDHCPRSFHQKCHLPHIEDAVLRDVGLWMCTYCVFRTNQEFIYWDEVEREVAMSSQISQRMLECQYLLLRLRTADEEQEFATNPSVYLKGYSTVIRTPMWLGNVADKLQERLYQTVGEFVSDVQLIFSNCASYNRDNAEFLAMGNRLKELFDRDFKNVFIIRE